jgi:hypothetical protein
MPKISELPVASIRKENDIEVIVQDNITKQADGGLDKPGVGFGTGLKTITESCVYYNCGAGTEPYTDSAHVHGKSVGVLAKEKYDLSTGEITYSFASFPSYTTAPITLASPTSISAIGIATQRVRGTETLTLNTIDGTSGISINTYTGGGTAAGTYISGNLYLGTNNLYINTLQVTATATEINYLTGASSSLQNQINSKAPKSNAEFLSSTTMPGGATFVDGTSGTIFDMPSLHAEPDAPVNFPLGLEVIGTGVNDGTLSSTFLGTVNIRSKEISDNDATFQVRTKWDASEVPAFNIGIFDNDSLTTMSNANVLGDIKFGRDLLFNLERNPDPLTVFDYQYRYINAGVGARLKRSASEDCMTIEVVSSEVAHTLLVDNPVNGFLSPFKFYSDGTFYCEMINANGPFQGLSIFCTETITAPSLKLTGENNTDVNTLDKYEEGSFTLTLTGVDATVTGTAKYTIVGRVVTLEIPTLLGTSNNAATTITGMPSVVRPVNTQVLPAIIRDSGADATSLITINTAGVITLNKDVSTATFTTSGSKGIANSISVVYHIA